MFEARFIEGDQTRDHSVVRHGLRECNRLLIHNAARRSMKRNIRHPVLFCAAIIAYGEINSFCATQVGGQASNQNVVCRCYGALDAASKRRGVLTDNQAFFRGTFQKGIVYDHSQGSLARQVSDPLGKRDYFAEARSAWVALEQMLFYR